MGQRLGGKGDFWRRASERLGWYGSGSRFFYFSKIQARRPDISHTDSHHQCIQLLSDLLQYSLELVFRIDLFHRYHSRIFGVVYRSEAYFLVGSNYALWSKTNQKNSNPAFKYNFCRTKLYSVDHGNGFLDRKRKTCYS